MMNPLKKKAQEIIRRSKNLHEIVSDPDKLNEIYKHTVVWDGVALAKKGVVPVAGGILEDLYNIRLMGNIYNHRPSADPTKFSVLNQDLGLYSDEYQLGAVLDITNQHQMNFCGRSVGKSTVLTSLPAAHWGAFLPYFEQLRYGTDRPMGIRFILIGDNLNTSKAMLQYIRGYLIQNGLTEDLIDPNNDSKLYLRLINGTEYFVRSCNNVRGLNPFSFKSERFGRIVFGRTIILADEYSRVKRKNILDEELSAYMNFTKGCLFIANTTPWGQDNHAYKQSRDPRFKTRTFPTAANIHMQNRAGLVRLKRMYSATGQEWIWNEEFCGEPSANHGQIFPNSWIDDVTYTEEEMEKYGGLWSDNDIDMMAEGGKFRGHRYYLGGDPNKGKTGVTDHGNPRVTDDASLCVGEETTGSVLHLRWARLYTKNSHAVFSKIYGAEVDSGGYIDQFRWLYRKIPITKGLLDLNPGSGMVGAVKTAKTDQIKNIDTFDTDNAKLCEAAITWLHTLGVEGRFKIPNDMDLALAFRSFNTRDKRTGSKRTDLIWAIIFLAWNLQKASVSEWSPGSMQTGGASRIAKPTLTQVANYAGSMARPGLTMGGRH